MASYQRPSALPIRAHLAGIEVVGGLEGKGSITRPDHFVIVFVDDKQVAKSDRKPRAPAPQWEWQEDHEFLCHPSSRIRIIICRESRASFKKQSVGQHLGKVVELLENNATIDLKDEAGAESVAQIKIRLSLISQSEDIFEVIMNNVGADVSRLDNTTRATAIISALGTVLQLTKDIANIIASAHPILKVSATVMFSVYTVVQQAVLTDDTVRDLAENLREVLGVAKEFPDLLLIAGTTNVIEEIGRTSLKVALLIHEYTKRSFAGRILKTQSSDIKTRIAQCQKSFDDLKQKFDRRLGADTNRQVAKVDGAVQEIKGTLRTIKDDQKAKEIYKWLSAPDSSQNYHEAREKHQKGTCSWFLDGPRFRELKEKGGLLWIKGTAGCGKTVLCSTIIERIIALYKDSETASIAYAYFFFDGRDSQNDLQLHDKFIRSLVFQLSRQCDGIPAPLMDLYGDGYEQPSTGSLQDTLHRIIDGLPSTYVIIDSLDECIERKKILLWVAEIIRREMGNLHMVVASRPEEDIRKVLAPLDQQCVDLAGAPENRDIVIYLERWLALENKWDEKMQETIKSKLITSAHGMFRWVALQVMELEECSSEYAVLNQLDSLPTGLDETYNRILSKIEKRTDRTDIKTFIQWLSFATRPMALAEVAETVMVDFDAENGPRYAPSRRYRDERDVLKKCAGLITESEGRIKLAHFSIKEYLVSERLCTGAASHFRLAENLSHSLIAQTCLAYLLQFDASNPADLNTPKSSPLARYAAEYWIFHARLGGIDKPEPSILLTLAQNLFAPEGAAFCNWVRIWDVDEYSWYSMEVRAQQLRVKNIAAPLYYAARANLHRLSQCLLEKGADVNVQGGNYGNALQAASFERGEATVKLLLENGADVNAQGGRCGNALQAASSRQDRVIVKLLLEKGAAINAQGGEYGNALQAASSRGDEMIVKLLLEKGADVNAQGGKYGNALQAASSAGHEIIVKLLLENGADINARGGHYGNALSAASFRGYEAIVRLLLKKGANINVGGTKYGNALQAASFARKEGTVRLLLEKGADLNAQGGLYGNVLQAASTKGHEEIVKLLLEQGADANALGGCYGSALQGASTNGHEEVVKLLLEKGADVNALGGYYQSALQGASSKGREGIVKLLLEKGANVNALGGYHGSALQATSVRGNKAIAKLLLEQEADVNLQGGKFGNALQGASFIGDEEIVEMLLKKGADVNAQGGRYDSALQAASSKGHETIVKLLLEKGATVRAGA